MSDAQLRWLYANCAAVVAASHEDFGLTPLEGNTFGRPAVVLRAGGFLDTMVEGRTGCFIEELTETAVRQAILDLRALGLDRDEITAHAQRFGFEAFKETLVRECELALTARGLDPYPVPGPMPAYDRRAPHDNLKTLRRPLTVAVSALALLTVAAGAVASQQDGPWGQVLLAVAGGLAVATAALGRLRFVLRRRNADSIRPLPPRPFTPPEGRAQDKVFQLR